MALALAKGLKQNYSLEVIGRNGQNLDEFETNLGVSIQKTLFADAICHEKTMILCVKPSNLREVSPYLKGEAKALYSVLAGTSLESLHAISAQAYVRAMPNLAAEKGLSMTALVGDSALRDEAITLFESIGMSVWLGS